MDVLNREHDAEQEVFLPKSQEDILTSKEDSRDVTETSTTYLRLLFEIAMALAIAILLIHSFTDIDSVARTPVPQFPRKKYTFLEDPKYLHEDMFSSQVETLHTLHKWIDLSADGRGYVHIDDWESFGLSEPYSMQMNATHNEPVYMMSVFHQLHCLSYLVQVYQSAFDGATLTQELAHHSAHCFDYIRQSILCAADTSLEGSTDAGPGWGSIHECKDYDAVLAWANERTLYKWRKNMPEEAVL